MKTRAQRALTKNQKPNVSSAAKKQNECHIDMLPKEVACKILSYLSLAELCKMNYMSKHWQETVTHYLRYAVVLSFEDPDDMLKSYATAMRDRELTALLNKCLMLKEIKHFYPAEISSITRNPRVLTHSNVSASLHKLPNLRVIDISDLNLMSELRAIMPQLQMPVFRNTNGMFPRNRSFPSQWLNCPSAIREIELFGISLHHLPYGLRITKLHLQNVKFTNGLTRVPGAGKTFLPNLQSFMMNDCEWPEMGLEQTNMALCAGLASCRYLEVLHLTRSTIEPCLIKRIVQANWSRCKPFSKLKKLVLAANWTMHEDDIGLLLIASQDSLERIYLQKSLTRDMLMQALLTAEVTFPRLQVLKLGYGDELSPRESDAVEEGGDFRPNAMQDDRPCQLSDYGLRMAVEVFDSPHLNSLSINDSPYLNSPAAWLSEKGLSFWERLTEFTLSQCPTTSLDQFNMLLAKMKSLKILNLVATFPSPPKGCSRVGLSAGMNIGGATGIRAIISQPPVASAPSLLSIPDVAMSEVEEMIKNGNLPDSDTDDTMEIANPADGYRCTQVHRGCMTNVHKMRKAHIRSKALEKILAAGQTDSVNQAGTQRSSRAHRKAKRQYESTPRVRTSKRLRGQEVTPEEQPPEDQPPEDAPHQRLDTADGLNESDKVPSNGIVVPEEPEELTTAVSKRDCTPQQPSLVKQPPATSRVSPAAQEKLLEDDSHLHRCHSCGCVLESILPSIGFLQFFSARRREDLSTREITKICIKCLKKQCQAAKRNSSYPSIDALHPRQRNEDDVNRWHVFDSTSGYSRLCTYDQGFQHSSRHKMKGKAPLKSLSVRPDYMKGQSLAAAVTTNKGNRPNRKRGKVCLEKGKAPLNPTAAQQVKTSVKGESISGRTERGCRLKRPGLALGGEVNSKKHRTPCTVDKDTHTKDPFIEYDSDQVLRLDNANNKITNINISNCGFARLDLSNSHNLVALTANACPSLHTVRFSNNPSIAPNLVRVTQCPKMSLPQLISSFRDKHLTCDASSSTYVRTIEYEPMQEYDREEALIEMSLLPEANKVLVECHHLTAEAECVKVKTFYENLLKDMTSVGCAGYKSEKDFRIYADEEYGKKIIISHNIPSCSTKITPSCDSPHNCHVTSQHGHQLQGCSVLCFVYPIDQESERDCYV